MVANLIENGLVHGRGGGDGRLVSDAATRRAADVSDEGAGPARASASYLRAFRRGPGRPAPGLGLGLSIVAAVAERHGGPRDGAGATFTVALPVALSSQRS